MNFWNIFLGDYFLLFNSSNKILSTFLFMFLVELKCNIFCIVNQATIIYFILCNLFGLWESVIEKKNHLLIIRVSNSLYGKIYNKYYSLSVSRSINDTNTIQTSIITFPFNFSFDYYFFVCSMLRIVHTLDIYLFSVYASKWPPLLKSTRRIVCYAAAATLMFI